MSWSSVLLLFVPPFDVAKDVFEQKWQPLKCPFCQEECEPPSICSEHTIHLKECDCGSHYFMVPANGTRIQIWEEIDYYGAWIIRNLDSALGMVDERLPDKVAMEMRLYHVVFMPPKLPVWKPLTCAFCSSEVDAPTISRGQEAILTGCSCGAQFFAFHLDNVPKELNTDLENFETAIISNYDPERNMVHENLPLLKGLKRGLCNIIFIYSPKGGQCQ